MTKEGRWPAHCFAKENQRERLLWCWSSREGAIHSANQACLKYSQRPSKVPGGRSSCAHYASFQSITWFRTALSSPGWKRIRTIWSALAPVNTLGPRGRGLDSTEPRWFRDTTGAVWLHPQIKPRPTLRQLRHPPTQPLYQVGQFPLCSSAEGWRHPRWQSPFCKVSSDVLASL